MKFDKYILIIYLISICHSKKFLFSVIISVYNTGRYLNESIGSLLNQTVGFEYIQIILVNDGSNDNSENICLQYRELYKTNIIYIQIPHSGVSIARNIGLRYAKGLFINFLDSDDKWDSQAFKYAFLFFKLYQNVDIISCRIKYFESRNQYHFLDYKFRKTRLVNLTQEYNCIQLSASSSFFRGSSIKGRKFKEGVFSGEDIRFIFNILLIKPILIFIREAIYYYRKRSDSTSAIQNTEENQNFYLWTIKYVQQYLINKSLDLHKKILPFVQFYIAYEILFRLESKAYKFLNQINYKKYCQTIDYLLKQIDEKYFLEQSIFPSFLKIFALSRKFKSDITNKIILRNKSFIYSNYNLLNLNKYKYLIFWRKVDLSKNILHLEGEDKCWLPKDKFFYFCRLGNKTFYPKYYYYSGYDFNTMFGLIRKGRIICFDIILDMITKQEIHFYISYKNTLIEILTSFSEFAHMAPLENSYYAKENFIIKKKNDKLLVYKYNQDLEKSFESLYCNDLKNKDKEYIVQLRKEHFDYKRENRFNKTYEIWIITDREDQAGENGEYFFRYLNKVKPKGILFYFAIKKDSLDYNRLKRFYNIIDLNSKEYLKLILKSDKLITSCSERFIKNPLNEDGKFISDFYNFDYIYLQNGIIKDDLSKYLNKIAIQFDLIITSSIHEYNFLLSKEYGYTEKNIILTGLPRFDNLVELKKKIKKEKLIIIFPTWRMYIKGIKDLLTHNSIKSDFFPNTTYFQFYNNLINNEQLIQIMNKYDYKGIFCVHPNFRAQIDFFRGNKRFKIITKCNEQSIFAKSSLLITDYSSIFFDFGFIGKPVIYIHFDYEKYRNNHFPKGYFDYKKQGFGPICYDINCLINNIIDELEHKCPLKEIYSLRIKKFFRYFDEKNSFRTFNSIFNYKKKVFNKSYTIHPIILILFILLKIIKKCLL